MLSGSKKSGAAIAAKDQQHLCALRTVGRAGHRNAPSRRRHVSKNAVLHGSTAAPFKRHPVAKKSVVRRMGRESIQEKDILFDSLSSDHDYVAKPHYRRSSLPMDYRSLAGMTPKWYTNVKKRKSISNQAETSLGKEHCDEVCMENNTSMSSCAVVLDKGSDLRYQSKSLLTLLTTDTWRHVATPTHQYSTEKSVCPGSLTTIDQLGVKLEVDKSYTWCGNDLSAATIVLTPSTPYLSKYSEFDVIADEDKRPEAVQRPTLYIVRPRDVDKNDRPYNDGASAHSHKLDTVYKGVFCSSGCDCFSFCYSPSVEHTAPENKIDAEGSVAYAGYIGCNGIRKLLCDLHFVGAFDTVSDAVKPVHCVVHADSASDTPSNEHEDFVDNICVDCGREMTCDEMVECAFSVPICSTCSWLADDNMPSVDCTVSSDHGYARLSTPHIVCPSSLKETNSSSYAVCEHSEMTDIDVIDDITFLSFPSKLLMHKYIATQQHNSDPAAKMLADELARCERSWHVGHKSHRRVWFGSTKHRHIDRFTAHNRLNEQIELGLVKPVSTESTADLLGIKLTSSLSQNTNRTVVGRTLKCKNKHVSRDLQVQRPMRKAAKDRHYCLTRFRRKSGGAYALLGAGRVDMMKLMRKQAEEALQFLHVPSVITRNNCSKPGICHVCHSFASAVNFESCVHSHCGFHLLYVRPMTCSTSWALGMSADVISFITWHKFCQMWTVRH